MRTEKPLDPLTSAPFTIWAYTPDDSRALELRHYGHYLAKLLGGELREGFPPANGNGSGGSGRANATGPLLVYGETDQRSLSRLLGTRAYDRVLKQHPSSLIFIKKPRIPISHILLVLRIEEIDETATEWLIRFAQPSEADVAVLPILPLIPALYQHSIVRQPNLGTLLSPDTREGALLRKIASKLVDAHIDANLHIRQGEPIWQIKQELAAAEYDLIIVGEDPADLWNKWIRSETAEVLLRCTRKPLLIARKLGKPKKP